MGAEQLTGTLELPVARGGGDHVRAERARDEHPGDPEAAAGSHHQHAVSGLDRPGVAQQVPGHRVADDHHRRLDEVEVIGNRLNRLGRHRHAFGVAAVDVHPDDPVVGAGVRHPGQAGLAAAAVQGARADDAVAGGEPGDTGADLEHDPGGVGAGDPRQLRVEVRAAGTRLDVERPPDADGPHADHDLPRGGAGIGPVAQLEHLGTTMGAHDDRPHHASPIAADKSIEFAPDGAGIRGQH